MTNKVTVVDHGLCNLFNLTCALEKVGAKPVITRDLGGIDAAERLILPGVGAFEPAMRTLRELDLVAPIRAYAASGKPLLGICLGMQLLMGYSEENGHHDGLGLIQGVAKRFSPLAAPDEPMFKVPQICWNTLRANPARPAGWSDPLLAGVPEEAAVYFVHSYYVTTEVPSETLAVSVYAGARYSAMVRRANVWGAQFHPERSANDGLRILSNFASLP